MGFNSAFKGLISGYPTAEVRARRVSAYLVLSAILGLTLMG
jgi:hypothetical protein